MYWSVKLLLMVIVQESWKGALLVTSAMILIIQDDFGYPDTWPNTHDQKESG